MAKETYYKSGRGPGRIEASCVEVDFAYGENPNEVKLEDED